MLAPITLLSTGYGTTAVVLGYDSSLYYHKGLWPNYWNKQKIIEKNVKRLKLLSASRKLLEKLRENL